MHSDTSVAWQVWENWEELFVLGFLEFSGQVCLATLLVVDSVFLTTLFQGEWLSVWQWLCLAFHGFCSAFFVQSTFSVGGFCSTFFTHSNLLCVGGFCSTFLIQTTLFPVGGFCSAFFIQTTLFPIGGFCSAFFIQTTLLSVCGVLFSGDLPWRGW